MSRRAKIVATIGPATRAPEQLLGLVEAGMDVARLNFSHGTHEDHAPVVDALRRIAEDVSRPVAILQDLQGPKIRIGPLTAGSVHLDAGAHLVLTTTAAPGDADRISTPYAELPQVVRPGDDILLSDGLIRLTVRAIDADDVRCEIVEGGTLRERAGMNLPHTGGSAPSLTDKDIDDLSFGLRMGIDYVALSFVRRAADVEDLKARIRTHGAHAAVVAKLEKPQAIDNLEAILLAADVAMIARGDLGVELSPERVPFVQKDIILRAAVHKVPVITATQMLESMIEHPRPTRAEASDVANAILDGTDAVMLSGETAIGRHPLATVRMMHRIVAEAEAHAPYLPHLGRPRRADDEVSSFEDAAAEAACGAAADIKARAIVAFTESGFTARLISKYRPATPIFAVTPREDVCRRLALCWGVTPLRAEPVQGTGRMIATIDSRLRQEGLVALDDPLVILAGTPFGVPGTTNLVRLHRAGASVD